MGTYINGSCTWNDARISIFRSWCVTFPKKLPQALTGPLVLASIGLLRAKNTMSIIAQVFGGLSVLAFMWDLFGYSLVFSNDYGGIIGDFSNGLLIGVGYVDCNKFAPNIPAAAYALFMMMFATITPLLMTGGFAERLKFKSFLIFTVLWEILVFYPVAHAIVRERRPYVAYSG